MNSYKLQCLQNLRSKKRKLNDIDINDENFNNENINNNGCEKRTMTIKNNIVNTVIDVDKIKKINNYPFEFNIFCNKNNLNPPSIKSKNGKALSVMLNNPNFYWDRNSCNKFVNKFNIETNDSIQLFNKHEQWGIKTSDEIGKNYILYPYKLSNKHKMRTDFKYNGSTEQKITEINKIKSTIKNDYIDAPSNKWQLGHKNPETCENTQTNMVLQPPIQARYKDKFIFLDTLTKIPTPATLVKMYKSGKCPYTNNQLLQIKKWLNNIKI